MTPVEDSWSLNGHGQGCDSSRASVYNTVRGRATVRGPSTAVNNWQGEETTQHFLETRWARDRGADGMPPGSHGPHEDALDRRPVRCPSV